MFLQRQPDGTFASTPIFAGFVAAEADVAAIAQQLLTCEHEWVELGSIPGEAPVGCTVHAQRCPKCRGTRVWITGSSAALDAYAATLKQVAPPSGELQTGKLQQHELN
jgi:hypothetical protein